MSEDQSTARDREKARLKAYYEAHKEEIKAQRKAYRADHKEEISDRNAANYAAKGETYKAKLRAEYAALPDEEKEKIRAERRANYPRHAAKSNEYGKAWRAANREQSRAAAKAWREANKGRKYRMSPEEYEEMLRACAGRCPCCKVPFSALIGATPVVDHCHTRGHVREAVRGIICAHCNFVIGHANDDPGILRACASYLETFKQL